VAWAHGGSFSAGCGCRRAYSVWESVRGRTPGCHRARLRSAYGAYAVVCMAGLGAYAYNVENTVLGSRGLDDWACKFPRATRGVSVPCCALCSLRLIDLSCSCMPDFNQTKPMQRDAFTPFH
jgi:hypothetical protein